MRIEKAEDIYQELMEVRSLYPPHLEIVSRLNAPHLPCFELGNFLFQSREMNSKGITQITHTKNNIPTKVSFRNSATGSRIRDIFM